MKAKYRFKILEGKSIQSDYLLINTTKVKVTRKLGGAGAIANATFTLDAISIEALLKEAGYSLSEVKHD